MAILLIGMKTLKPSNKTAGKTETPLHPRIKYNGSTGTDVLAADVFKNALFTDRNRCRSWYLMRFHHGDRNW